MVDAAKELKNQDIHFYIYGDGTEKDMLEDECRKYSLNVKFEGRVEKKYITYILSNADLNIINVQGAGLNKYGSVGINCLSIWQVKSRFYVIFR